MKNYFAILIILTVIGLINLRSKNEHLTTFKRDNNLYIETYRAGLSGGLKSEYLTDSTNFRVYVGTFDDETGYFYYKIKGDDVYVEKKERKPGVNEKLDIPKVVERKVFNLAELKKRHLFVNPKP